MLLDSLSSTKICNAGKFFYMTSNSSLCRQLISLDIHLCMVRKIHHLDEIKYSWVFFITCLLSSTRSFVHQRRQSFFFSKTILVTAITIVCTATWYINIDIACVDSHFKIWFLCCVEEKCCLSYEKWYSGVAFPSTFCTLISYFSANSYKNVYSKDRCHSS